MTDEWHNTRSTHFLLFFKERKKGRVLFWQRQSMDAWVTWFIDTTPSVHLMVKYSVHILRMPICSSYWTWTPSCIHILNIKFLATMVNDFPIFSVRIVLVLILLLYTVQCARRRSFISFLSSWYFYYRNIYLWWEEKMLHKSCTWSDRLAGWSPISAYPSLGGPRARRAEGNWRWG